MTSVDIVAGRIPHGCNGKKEEDISCGVFVGLMSRPLLASPQNMGAENNDIVLNRSRTNMDANRIIKDCDD